MLFAPVLRSKNADGDRGEEPNTASGADVHGTDDGERRKRPQQSRNWSHVQPSSCRAEGTGSSGWGGRRDGAGVSVSAVTDTSLQREVPADEVPDTAPVPDFTATTDEADRLLAALRTLPPRQRQAVVLRYLEDLSTAQTADLMGCAQGTVKRAAHDGLNALRSRLTEHAER